MAYVLFIADGIIRLRDGTYFQLFFARARLSCTTVYLIKDIPAVVYISRNMIFLFYRFICVTFTVNDEN